jgi:RNA recognition motif-containing protein
MRLFVANFLESTEEEDLKELFEQYGSVEEVDIWIDNSTGRSREFGFVTMLNEGSAEHAIKIERPSMEWPQAEG